MNNPLDYVRGVDHSDEADRAILRQVYAWAEASPAIYLEGNGYRDAEDFVDPPDGSIEFIVFVNDRPAALLTLMPLVVIRKTWQAGLITNPDASLRKICKELRDFMPVVYTTADTLFVDLPNSPEFEKTRKLARFFGLERVSDKCFLLTKRAYEQKKTGNELQRSVPELRDNARRAGGQGFRPRPDQAQGGPGGGLRQGAA
jgi:hypothetical protein